MTKDLPVSATRTFFSRLPVSLLLIALAATGCNARKGSPANAHLEGNTYTNAFFEFSLNIPGGWTIANEETLRQAKQVGGKLLSGGDKEMEAALDHPDKNSYQLIAVSERPMGAPVAINPNFALVAERISVFSAVKTGSDYLAHVNTLLTGTGKPFQQVAAPYKTKFAGREFYRMDMSARVAGRSIHQAYLATIEKGFALALVVTGGSKEGADDVLARIGSGPATP